MERLWRFFILWEKQQFVRSKVFSAGRILLLPMSVRCSFSSMRSSPCGTKCTELSRNCRLSIAAMDNQYPQFRLIRPVTFVKDTSTSWRILIFSKSVDRSPVTAVWANARCCREDPKSSRFPVTRLPLRSRYVRCFNFSKALRFPEVCVPCRSSLRSSVNLAKAWRSPVRLGDVRLT